MAKSFKEIGRKAEALIEQGREADRKVQACQARVTSSNSRVVAARRQLAEASETDENGNPMGNTEQARAQLIMAENMLEASQRALSFARGEADRVRQQKNAHVQEIERHNQVERSNFEKLQRLRAGVFGADSVALTEGMAQRLNEAEDAKVALLRSMGLEATADYVSVSGESNTDSAWRGGGFAAIDVSGHARSHQGGAAGDIRNKAIATPTGGGLKDLLSTIFQGKTNETATKQNVLATDNRIYTQIEELSDEVYYATRNYQENSRDYNTPLRNNQTSKEIEHFRNIINSHSLLKESVFIRTASVDDFGPSFTNVPVEEWAGRCYQFGGIMSASNNPKLARGNVVFEIKAKAGTPALDLTRVPSFNEVMFDSPFCLIENVRKEENSSTTHVTVRILSAGDGLNRVNDYDALEKYMKTKHNIQLNESIRSLNPVMVKSAIAGIESVIDDYPDVGVLLNYGITSDMGIMSCTGSKLSFNPDYFTDNSRLHKTCRKMSEQGFWIANANPVSIGVHEAAHGVEKALIEANSWYTTPGQKIQAWNNCTEATKIVQEACSRIRNTEYGLGKTRTELVRSISTYALENDSETMAEAFADVYANGDNAKPLSKTIKMVAQELMEKYKGGKKNVDN